MKKLVLAVLFSGAAFTAQANPAKADKFQSHDADKDGALDKTEAGAADSKLKAEDAYKKADANSDGKLSKEEFTDFEKGAHTHK